LSCVPSRAVVAVDVRVQAAPNAMIASAQAEPEPSYDGNFCEPVIIAEADSLFGRIFVVDEGRLRHLRFARPDAVDQSVIDREDGHHIAMPHLRAAMLATIFVAAPRRALVVGLGGGGFVLALRHRFPALRIDAVEIDPVVVRVACSHFGVGDERLHIYVDDAATFMERHERGTYDVILLDAYDGPDIPAHLTTRSFYRQAARQLSPLGVALANVSATTDRIERGIAKRFARAFAGSCFELQVPEDENHVLVAAHWLLPAPANLPRLAHSVIPQIALASDITVRTCWPFPSNHH